MPELRKDPISHRSVIIATERGRRPTDFSSTPSEVDSNQMNCVFCFGNESKTPPEIIALGRPLSAVSNSPNWEIRVVPNKFPALTSLGDATTTTSGLFESINGIGAHEVVIDSPHHQFNLSDLEITHIVKVFKMYQDRLLELKKDKRFQYSLVFKNVGTVAGASLFHPHSQILSTPIVPEVIKTELHYSNKYYDINKHCLFCDLIKQELISKDRIVCENDSFVVLTPYASRFPFEMCILPKVHASDFTEIQLEGRLHLASCLKDVLTTMKKILKDPPYNYYLHTEPNINYSDRRVDIKSFYHWHIEIIPRLTKIAGVEFGTGIYINPTPPEIAATYLRDSLRNES